MKILMSSYVCDPVHGSEPGAGWAYAVAAAQDHDVWLMTDQVCQERVEAALANDPELAERMTCVPVRSVRWLRAGRGSKPIRVLHYLIWQLVSSRRVARELTRSVRFDLAHHVVFASDWLPTGLSGIGVPFVWGPVGGASTKPPLRLLARLGAWGFLEECFRAVIVTAAQRTVGRRVARRAALVVAQNDDVAAAYSSHARVVIEPNVVIEEQERAARCTAGAGQPPIAVFAGRLLALKGVRLALAALRQPEAAHWHLHVYGDGPERKRLMRTAKRWDLEDRVTFFGWRPRTEVREAMASADVFFFPSVHDSAPWSVAEAIAAGCPVVALGLGGPVTIVGEQDGVLVPPRGDVVAGLAAALDEARTRRPVASRWTPDRMPAVLKGIYAQATSTAHMVAEAPELGSSSS